MKFVRDHIVIFIVFLFSVLPWTYLTNRLFLVDPPVVQDEAVIFDISQNLGTTGIIKSDIFKDTVPNMSSRALMYPPLFHVLQVGWMRLFGTTIEAARSMSVSVSFVTLCIIFYAVRSIFRSTLFGALAVIFISLDPMFGRISRVARMESIAYLFLSSSILFLLHHATSVFTRMRITLLGVLSGLAVLTHPVGVIAPVIIFSRIPRRFYGWFALPIIAAFILWAVYIGGDWAIALKQYQLEFTLKKDASSIFFLLFSVDMFTRIRGALVIVAIVLSVISRSLLIIGITIVMYIVVLVGKDLWYLAYLPFVEALVFLEVITVAKRSQKIFFVGTAWAMLLLSLSFNIFKSFEVLSPDRFANNRYHEFTSQVSNLLPQGSTVLMANVPDPYFDLRQRSDLTLLEFHPVSWSKEAYQDVFHRADIIILNTIYPEINEYAGRNKAKSTVVHVENGYETEVIYLLPRQSRK